MARINSTRGRTVLVFTLAAAASGIAVSQFQGAEAAKEVVPSIAVTKGTIVVTVGGVGRIVEATPTGAISLPSGGSSSSGSGLPAESAANAVFPKTSGQLGKILVRPGTRVRPGQAIAMVDDNGAAAAATAQARIDVTTAQLELQQKQSSDPATGSAPTQAELLSADAAVASAQARLERLLAPPAAAEMAAARAEVSKAAAELALLLQPTATGRPLPQAVKAAQSAVRAATGRLRRATAAPDSASITTAQAELAKAKADLAALERPPSSPLAETVDAARSAVEAARRALERATAPADAAAVSAAEAELAKARADLAILTRAPVTPLPEELAAARRAVTVAEQNLVTATAGTDPSAIAAAQLELDRARAALAVMQRTAPAPLPEELAAANAAVSSAQLKLTRAQAPYDVAAAAAATADLSRATAELASLQRPPAPPLPAELASARAAVTGAQERLARARRPADAAEVAAASAEVDRAVAELAVLTRKPAVVPAKSLQGARDLLRAAKLRLAAVGRPGAAEVATARADLRRAEADRAVLTARGRPAGVIDTKLARLKLDGALLRLAAARRATESLVVRSPRGGTVTSLLSVVGAPVDGTTPIAAISDLENLEALVDLSEFDVARVRPGLQANVGIDAFGGRLVKGVVRFAALTGTSAGGVVTFPVRVGLAGTGGLRPGMNVSVRIVVARRAGVIQVPLEAVTENEDGEPVVTVLTPDGKASIRPVELGLSSSKAVEILDGLRVGQRILVGAADTQPQGEEE